MVIPFASCSARLLITLSMVRTKCTARRPSGSRWLAALCAGVLACGPARSSSDVASCRATAPPADAGAGLSVVTAEARSSAGSAVDHRREGVSYTMDDLVALEQQRGYLEILEHLSDVAPAKRDAAWEGIAERAAVAWLAVLSTDREPLRAAAAADDLTKRYPTLRESEAFMGKRAAVGIEGFRACYAQHRSGEPCTERLLGFVQAAPDDAALAMSAGRLVIRNQFPYVAVRFFKLAVVGRSGQGESCADPELNRAVLAAEASLPKDHPLRADAAQIRAACKGR